MPVPTRVGESDGRLWPGCFTEESNSTDGRLSARKADPSPHSTRGLGRSSSVPNGRPPPSVSPARPPVMPRSPAEVAVPTSCGYPGQARLGSRGDRESGGLKWSPPRLPVSAHGPGPSTALEADLGMDGDSFHPQERRAQSQLSFIEGIEDVESIRPPHYCQRDDNRGARSRGSSADAAMSVQMQGWSEPSLMCTPTGVTPSIPLFHRQPSASSASRVLSMDRALDPGEVEARENEGLGKFAQDELAVYTEVAADDTSQAPGLGSIQPQGRAQVLQQWCNGRRREPTGVQDAGPPGSRQNGSHPLEAVRSLLRLPHAANSSSDAMEIEWSSLGDAAKNALKQWCSGQLGGRHCMLTIEHNSGTEGGLDMEDSCLQHFRSGAALNVLSGLQAEMELITCHDGSWLFDAVFSKPPAKVLEDGIQAALEELGSSNLQCAGDLSVEQANLALRRRAMKVQCVSPFAKPSAEHGPRSADEFLRTQVWLELLRQCVDGPKEGGQAMKDKDKPPKGERPAAPWNDAGVLRDLGKSELDLEVESEKMSLDAIRMQNRHIEEYVMRLVRQRDELKSMMKMTEERDSYFILGLEGPESTEEEVKKAYRALARKEHPDKAGIGNKRRFQAIQQAYTSILRQKSEGGALGAANSPNSKQAKGGLGPAGAPITEALSQARLAKEAADRVAVCAHRTIKSNEDCAELQSAPKRRAMRAMKDLTRQSIAELQCAAEHLRALGDSVCAIAKCVDDTMNEQNGAADKTVAGIGLRDRAVIVDDAGRSSLTSAELLDRISEATEATLRKVEKADAGPGSQDGGLGLARAGRDEAANLLRLGVRLLSESLTRTAAVARRSADEAIGAAIKGHELSRSLAAVDLEARKEREKAAAKTRSFDVDEDVIAAKGPPAEGCSEGGNGAEGATSNSDDAAAGKTPQNGASDGSGQTSPRDQLKSAAKRVKERHVALRVKNLHFMTTLNEEALKLQNRLRHLLERSEGALLPEVSVLQKKQVFDLVSQLFDHALAEIARLVVSPNVATTTPSKVFDRVFSFALALEHNKEVAMPAESRTQALKLAALVDSDLLCQVIGGPFRTRLTAVVSRRGSRNEAAVVPHGRLQVRRMSSECNAKAWTDAADTYCAHILSNIKAFTHADEWQAPLA